MEPGETEKKEGNLSKTFFFNMAMEIVKKIKIKSCYKLEIYAS